MSSVKEKENMAERIETDLEEEIIDFEEVGSGSKPPRDIKINRSIENNRNLLVGVGIGVLVVIGGYFGYKSYQESNEQKAVDDSIYAFKFYEKDSLDKAIKGESGNKGLKKLVDDYSGTKTGNLARYMLGTTYLAQNKIKEGTEQLEAFNKGEDMVSATSYSALAYAYEEQGKFEDAANMYLKAGGIQENTTNTPDYMMQAARCYEEAKNTDKALGLYKEIKQKYPLSEAGQSVDKYIAKLSKE